MQSNKVIFLLGPTASGKTKLGLLLAKALDAEIVNSDAFAFYKNCDILTAKVSKAEMNSIPHHMVDFLEIDNMSYTVNDYLNDAVKVIEDIHNRSKTAIVVGGSNYYAESLLYKTSENQCKENGKNISIDEAHKQIIRDLIEKDKIAEVGDLLKDKYSYESKFHKNDLRRRKNEFQRLVAPNSLFVDKNCLRYLDTVILLMNNKDDEFVISTIENRINSMIYEDKGLIEIMDVLSYLESINKLDQQAKCGVLQAIGYKEFIDLFNYQKYREKIGRSLYPSVKNGEVEDNKANEFVKAGIVKLNADTLKLVKKQKKWIKNKIAANTAVHDRTLVLDLDSTKLNKSSIDAYFNEIVSEFIHYLNTKEYGHYLKSYKAEIEEHQFYCKSCKLNFKTKRDFKHHRKTPQHKNPLGLAKKADAPVQHVKNKRIKCDICDRVIPENYMNRHVKGKSHKSKEKKVKPNVN